MCGIAMALGVGAASCGGGAEHRDARAASHGPSGSTTPAPSSSERDYFPQQTDKRDVGTGVEFEIASMPIGAIPDAKTKRAAPAEVTTATESTDAVDLRPGPATRDSYQPFTLRVRGLVVGQIRVHGSWQRVTKDNDAMVYCDDPKAAESSSSRSSYYGRNVVELRFEGLTRQHGSVVYSVTDAWLDTKSCKVKIDDPVIVPLGEIVPGLLYGFRSCTRQPPNPPKVEDELYADADKCTEPNRLNLLLPHAQKMVSSSGTKGAPPQLPAISRVILPLHQGTSASFAASVPVDGVRDWARRFGASEDLARTAVDPFVMSVEIEQTSEEDAPRAVVFLGEENDMLDPNGKRRRPSPPAKSRSSAD
jgi:hypothetical protein